MEPITMDTKVSLKIAYLSMFEYLKRYYHETGKPDELGLLLGELSLWDSFNTKVPLDGAMFPNWLKCAKKVIDDENTETGYRDADIQLVK